MSRKTSLNPNSEIQTGNLPQSLGHKRIEKIPTDHFGYASIFSIRFCSNILRQLAGLNFGIRVKGFGLERWLALTVKLRLRTKVLPLKPLDEISKDE